MKRSAILLSVCLAVVAWFGTQTATYGNAQSPMSTLENYDPQTGQTNQGSGSGGEKTKPGTVNVNPSSYLNVRTGPWGKIIGKLHDGDKVEIVSTSGEWHKIKYKGSYAYIHVDYVSTSGGTSGGSSSGGGNRNDPQVTAGSGRFGAAPCSPMPSRASSEYGPRNLFGHSFHRGIDLPVPNGTRLNALGDGVVTAVGYESGGGRFVKVRYANGYESFYCHLQSYSVRQGQRVYMGQEIARSDNTGQWTTGAHLHMGIYRNGQAVNPRSVPGLPLPPRR